MENEELEYLSVVIGDNGCTFSYQCDLRSGKIYHYDSDARSEGEVNYHRMYLDSG